MEETDQTYDNAYYRMDYCSRHTEGGLRDSIIQGFRDMYRDGLEPKYVYAGPIVYAEIRTDVGAREFLYWIINKDNFKREDKMYTLGLIISPEPLEFPVKKTLLKYMFMRF